MGSFFRQLSCYDLWLSVSLCLLATASTARGQTIPDGTLPRNSLVTSNGNTVAIEDGTQVGSHLFHSFQEFSVPTGSNVFFNNALDVENIINRVTGGSTSTIDGLIRANGTANLFLINPNGIIFGQNAQLDIGGSFLASTASSIQFAADSEFSAINPQAPPLLTVNLPIGLQFGSNPAPIINQSLADSLSTATPRVGLENPGRTLALVGGDLTLEGGNLTASGGQIELGSVASSGLVSLTPTATGFTLGYQAIQDFGNIKLTGAAVNVTGLGAGTIRVRGEDVTLLEGSKLVAETFGDFDGGGIDIQATQFSLQDRAFVSTSTFGAGAGGTLSIHADTVELTGTTPSETSQQLLAGTFNPLNLSNGLFSLSGGSGAAGDLTIDASQLMMQNGANILTTAFATGRGGDLTLSIFEVAELANGSLVLSGTAGNGDAGDLAVTAKQLRVLDGTAISTTTSGASTGSGGKLTVLAEFVDLRGTPAFSPVPGGLFTATLGDGDAGDLTITTTGQLIVADGAQISSSSAGSGRGGKLTVAADSIALSGISADGRFLSGLLTSSSLLTVSGQRGTASAGDLSVTTRQLSVQNGAQISAATGSDGAAGNLTINASESVEVTGFATGVDPSVEKVSFGIIGDGIVPSAIEANTSGAGMAGDLTIDTSVLTVRDGAEIGVRSTSSGAAGGLTVTADSIVLSEQGAISAINVSGDGGNIQLNAQTIQLNNGTITATSRLGEGGNITLQVQEDLVLRNYSEISTRAGTEDTGGGNGGNITINAELIVAVPGENSDITANAFNGSGGNINITAQGIFGLESRNQLTPLSDITASSKLGVDGVVELTQLSVDPSQGLVELPENVVNNSDRIATGCPANEGNSFAITGRGGLPENPTGTLRGRTVWQDLRFATSTTGAGEQERIPKSQPSEQNQQPAPLAEAKGWVINTNGQVELVTLASEVASQPPLPHPASCSK
jgi:filamentous hemagglutinin family protein